MGKMVKSWHAHAEAAPDQAAAQLAAQLKTSKSRDDLLALYGRYVGGMSDEDALMRSAIWRALSKSCGSNLSVGAGAIFRNIETFVIGNHVFIGPQSYIQGRHDGHCVIGDRVWLGPQSFLDARDVELGSYVGWGPGARLLGSQHSGLPSDVPIIQTDLEIKPVRINAGADVGTSAVIMPGVTVGEGAIVGAGAVVTGSVEPYSIVAGVPARFLRWREGHEK